MEITDTLQHNKDLLPNLKLGDSLEFERPLYSHFAVYIEDGKVLHLTGEFDAQPFIKGCMSSVCSINSNKGAVRVDNFLDVAKDSKVVVNNTLDVLICPGSDEEIMERCNEVIERKGYNVFSNNCEHLVNYCRYGIFVSTQAIFAFIITGTLIIGVCYVYRSYIARKTREAVNWTNGFFRSIWDSIRR